MKEDNIKKVEIDGYKLEFDQNNLDDVEVFELINDIEEGEVQKTVKLLKLLLGENEYNKVKDYFVNKYGRFSINKLTEVYTAIFQGANPKD